MGSLKARLNRDVGRAIADYGLIQPGDHVAVAVSGGKDSLTLLDILMDLRRRAPVKFDLVAVTVDQGFEGFRWPVMEKHFKGLGVPYHIENTAIASVIEDHKDPGSSLCAFCARLRRGVLYRLAREKGWSKIALGHHADDLIETLLMSMLFNGTIQSMPPILKANDGSNVVIRPLCYAWEDQVIAYARERSFPVISCACAACTDLTLKRKRVKALLKELEASWPGIKGSLLHAQKSVRVTQLADPRFLPLGAGAKPMAEAVTKGRHAPASHPAFANAEEAACGAMCGCGPMIGADGSGDAPPAAR
jgi:tRNA 2-thiocytidine biosynthesis protein TtcA